MIIWQLLWLRPEITHRPCTGGEIQSQPMKRLPCILHERPSLHISHSTEETFKKVTFLLCVVALLFGALKDNKHKSKEPKSSEALQEIPRRRKDVLRDTQL